MYIKDIKVIKIQSKATSYSNGDDNLLKSRFYIKLVAITDVLRISSKLIQ